MIYKFIFMFAMIGAAAQAREEEPFQYVEKGEREARDFCEVTNTWPTAVDETKVIDPGIISDVAFRGNFPMGTSSLPVLVALLKDKANGQVDLYVDMDRNGQLNDKDLAKSIGEQLWQASIFTSDDSLIGKHNSANGLESKMCLVEIRKVENRLEVANAGRFAGVVALEGQLLKVNVEDRNCNGLWTDSDDRLQIDLNNDGTFSPLRERFSCQGTATVRGTRFALAFADNHLSLKPIEGTGYVTAKLSLKDQAATIESCQAVLASTDGIHVTLSSLSEQVEVPVGEYRVKSLRVAMKDDRKWLAVFEQDTSLKPAGIKVERGQSVTVELLGKLKLSADITAGNLNAPRNGQVVIVPMLASESGLYLAKCLVGKTVAQSDNTLTASVIQLGAIEKKVSAIESTGFACGSFCPIVFSGKEFGIGKALIMVKFDSGPLAGMMSETAGKPKVK